MASIFFIFIIIWSFFWKGLALWNAARASHKKWFVSLFLINSFGILEIIYILKFSKKVK